MQKFDHSKEDVGLGIIYDENLGCLDLLGASVAQNVRFSILSSCYPRS